MVSVIIPCYGYAPVLGGAIDSVLAQTYGPVEIIVVDDGSPDDVAGVTRRYGKRVRSLRQANAGPGAARNAGLAVMRGSYVVFLDAGDLLAPTMLAAMIGAAQRNSTAGVFAGAWNEVDAAGRLLRSHAAPQFGNDALHALLPSNPAPPVCYMFGRDAVLRIGGFDPDRALSGHEDWDLLLRLAASGERFISVPDALSMYRVSAGSLSANRRRMYWSGRAVLQRAWARIRRCPECRVRLIRSQRGFATMYLREVLWPSVRDNRSVRGRISALAQFTSDLKRDPALGRRLVGQCLSRMRADNVLVQIERRLGIGPIQSRASHHDGLAAGTGSSGPR
jgi:glycosyltransferase involved in cell wall biosynthesis